jgi:hypothetical protein
VVGGGALGDVDGGMVSGSREAQFPAGLLGAAFLLAFLNGGDAVCVCFAGGPFLGALFLDALLRIGNLVAHLEGGGD